MKKHRTARGSAHADRAVPWRSPMPPANAAQRALQGVSLRCCGSTCMRGMLKQEGCFCMRRTARCYARAARPASS